MDRERLLGILYQQNPWWESLEFRPIEATWPKREQFLNLEDYLAVPQVVLLTGLRRTGKTTLLRQMIAKLLNQTGETQRVCFFSFEEGFGIEDQEVLETVIDLYFERILREKLTQVKSPTYLFLDEIQYIPNWQIAIKRIYDLNKNIKFFLSGSASTQLVWRAKESLAGRLFEITLPILSFAEYLKLKGEKDIPTCDLKNIGDTQELENEIARRGDFLDQRYSEYLVRGQFPELIEFANYSQIQAYLRDSVLEKVIAIDLPKVFTIQEQTKFRQLFLLLASESGNLIEMQNLASDLSLSRQTITDYTSFLEAGFLVKLVYQFTKARGRARRQRKIYVASSNFTASLEGFDETTPLFRKVVGHLVETAVFGRLDYLFDRVFFWRRREKEVDFVVENSSQTIPIEVKFARKINSQDFSNISYFMEQRGLKEGVILTHNMAAVEKVKGKTLFLLPAWAI